MTYKLLIFILFFYPHFFQASANQKIEEILNHADSLFDNQKYTQALDKYQHILHDQSYFNRPMLLKMAFIYENIEDHTQALYCLNLLYQKYPNKAILAKMEELAEGEELLGYQYTDTEYFVSIYRKYYFHLMTVLIVGSLFGLVYLFFKSRTKSGKLGYWPLGIFLSLFLSLFFNNYDIIPTKAIISNAHSLLMSAPSASSDAVAKLDKGHRVVVDKTTDVWCKIDWNGRPVYIRKNNLLFINPH